jgi:exosortase A-associated hydrolase 1
MRRILTFACEGAALVGTLNDAPGATGLLIVSGGNEIRAGAHRGMVQLAADIAAKGHPVFRFDRRGIGDSEGENGEFTSSAADLDAAIAAFRSACPHINRIVAFGNCDAATAILLHRTVGLNAAVLANIWVIERTDEMPPPAAIKARYLERLKDPSAWIALFTGAINLKKLANGLFRLAKGTPPSSLPQQIADGLAAFAGPISIILAAGDATAIAFADEWEKPHFDVARSRKDLILRRIDSNSHSFARAEDYQLLVTTLLDALK